ncbi:MAG: DUF502 domain-containing protein [Cytophagales bacterium]|jgi:uncharacterized membrane protein|nr:DUF502 domain-containing protein [Cytophagales bacterium]
MKYPELDKGFINVIFSYFIRGVLTIVPFALTWFILTMAIGWVDNFIDVNVPGLGAIISVGVIIFFGYIAGSFFAKSIFTTIESAILKMPGVSLLYSSIKEFISGILDKKLNFDRPVLVTTNNSNDTNRIGFITNEDLGNLGLDDMVAVYVPTCYSFSGELFLIPKKNVTPINCSSGARMMKFVVSGGIIDTKADLKNSQEQNF